MNDAVMAHDPEILADPVSEEGRVLKSQDDYDPESRRLHGNLITEDEVVEYVVEIHLLRGQVERGTTG